MIPGHLRESFNQILRLTNAGQLHWKVRDHFGDEVYFCERNGFEIQIVNHWDSDAERVTIYFTVVRPDGDRGSFSTTQWDDDYPEVRQLYELATISAANITNESLKGFFS